ncbi:type II and III secretion system protein family protein [Frigidibacter sp. SD6-1]|uniref:type II and III secretion system protein family protein n=1 Tax=Frigidibacter sp. SD6-1 TaxID=3032581 RepID=UPI0024E038D9|nr:type II and III secretion system protein family protein [Frigidibacter sp. SD6-1]
MSAKYILTAGLLGLVLGTPMNRVHAETLKVVEGSTSSTLEVPMNRAVVVEADQPFAELSIANPAIADISTLSDKSIYVLGKAPGRTTLTLLGPDGKLITNVDVQVSLDVAEFKERLKQILPNENIEVRTANDGIVLSGVVSSIAALDRALDLAERYAPQRVSNLMGVGGTQQVMLKVRFAEMQRSVGKTLNGGLLFNSGNVGGGTGTGGLTLRPDPTTPGRNVIDTGFRVSQNFAGAGIIDFSLGGVQLAAMLEALESKGLVRTLAEPNLTALSGQEAKFLAGGEYPIPVPDKDNNVTIEYKPFGVELAFTPRVVDGDIINIALNAAVSGIDTTVSIQNGSFAVNAFKRREAETTVEVRDGESFAIAGLLQDEFTDLNNQVPWLGDIPVLGILFRSADYQRNQTELVIIVTPHLVSPVRGEALALPTDRVKPPTEAQLFLFGQTSANGKSKSGSAAEVAKQDFSGSYGYVME